MGHMFPTPAQEISVTETDKETRPGGTFLLANLLEY